MYSRTVCPTATKFGIIRAEERRVSGINHALQPKGRGPRAPRSLSCPYSPNVLIQGHLIMSGEQSTGVVRKLSMKSTTSPIVVTAHERSHIFSPRNAY